MKTVPTLRVVSTSDTTDQLRQLNVELPAEIQLALAEIGAVAREGLLAMSAAAGMAVMQAMFDAEIAAACGPKGRHDADRSAMRHGREKGSVVLGGRRVRVTRPRARTVDGHEVPLPTYHLFAGEQQLTAVVMERMLAGLATRRLTAAAEPVGADVEQAASATSRSAISCRFVAQTKTALAELLARDLSSRIAKVSWSLVAFDVMARRLRCRRRDATALAVPGSSVCWRTATAPTNTRRGADCRWLQSTAVGHDGAIPTTGRPGCPRHAPNQRL